MITIERLTKRYGGFTAVDDVTLHRRARPGHRLPRPQRRRQVDHACASWSGSPRPRPAPPPSAAAASPTCPTPGCEVGVLLDASAQHAGRTGREILTLAQRIMGLPARRVEEMLDLVSLTADRGRPPGAATTRSGMRQRLGIATALIGDPEVLILDEPANGLDPAGIRWMRDLLRGYADRGGTVLLSSHLLHEIEVDRRRPRGDRQRPDRRPGHQGRAARTRPAPSSAPPTCARLGRALDRRRASRVDRRPTAAALRTDADPALVGQVALDAGVALTELRAADGAGLEEMFLELTADTQREGAAA